MAQNDSTRDRMPLFVVQFVVPSSRPLERFTNEPCGFHGEGGKNTCNCLGIAMNEFWWDVAWSTGTTACGIESLLSNVEVEGDAICLKLQKETTIDVAPFSCKIKKCVEVHFETFFDFASV